MLARASESGARFVLGGLGGRFFLPLRPISPLCRGRPRVGRVGEPQQRLGAAAPKFHGLTYGVVYARTTGRRDGFGIGDRDLKTVATVPSSRANPLRNH